MNEDDEMKQQKKTILLKRKISAKQANTGCFKVKEIMFLLISQPIKHLNRLDRSHIFTESIAF